MGLQVVEQILVVVVISSFLVAQIASSQKYQTGSKVSLSSTGGDEQQVSGDSLDSDQSGERVEKLVRASGDLYWHPIAQQSRYSDDQLGPQYQLIGLDTSTRSAPLWALSQQQRQFPVESRIQVVSQPVDELLAEAVAASANSNSHRALVDDFKHWSRVANPSRESRAFKPKLMSTARGFGKRTPAGYPHHLIDLLASGSLNGPLGVKLSEKF